MPPAVFEPKISADERPKTYALDGGGHRDWKTNLFPLYINISIKFLD